MFSRLFHSHKMNLLALLGLLQTEMADFLSISYTTTSEIPTFSYNVYRKPEKYSPFEHYRKYPLANKWRYFQVM